MGVDKDMNLGVDFQESREYHDMKEDVLEEKETRREYYLVSAWFVSLIT